jgi:hypothetical protein
MKKEDLLKPCSEEKPGLKLEIGSIKIILLTLLLFSLDAFSQVPINGFCKYNRIDIDSGFTHLFALNYNDDSYADLVLYNPAKKDIETLEGNQSLSFSAPRKYKIPSEISLIRNIIDKNNNTTGYVYCSRKRLSAGFLSFAKSGKPIFSNEIKLHSYPGSVCVADIDGNSESEFLISGNSFDGLSILTTENRKLKETKILRNSVYSFSRFIDISGDGFPDIAAFNVASFNLDLFYNNGSGEFNKVRSIPISGNINSLRVFDLDIDSKEDIIISKENSIEIYYADFNSSFDIKKVIKTKYNPEKIIEGDFNKDGRMDIVYLDTKTGTLSILFGKEGREFYPEVTYLRKNGSMDLVPFYSKFINGIAIINKYGSLYLISNFTSMSGESDISLGVSQQGLNYFDHNRDGIPDLCFIDNAENKLNLILRNNSGIPSSFYSVPLVGEETKIFPDYLDKNKVTFYCYTEGKKLIESVTMNFINSTFGKKSFYVKEGIVGIRTEHNKENDVKLYVVQLDNGKLSLSVFNSIEVNYLNSTYSVADNVINVSCVNEYSRSLCFWQNNSDSLILCSAAFRNNFENPEIKYSIKIKKDYNIQTLSGDFFTNHKDAYFSIIRSRELNLALTLSGNTVCVVDRKEIIEKLTVHNIKRFYVAASNFKGLDKIFFYSEIDKNIKKIDLINNGKNIIIHPVADVQYVGDYFIKNLDMRNFHLVFTNNRENCITIKQLQ